MMQQRVGAEWITGGILPASPSGTSDSLSGFISSDLCLQRSSNKNWLILPERAQRSYGNSSTLFLLLRLWREYAQVRYDINFQLLILSPPSATFTGLALSRLALITQPKVTITQYAFLAPVWAFCEAPSANPPPVFTDARPRIKRQGSFTSREHKTSHAEFSDSRTQERRRRAVKPNVGDVTATLMFFLRSLFSSKLLPLHRHTYVFVSLSYPVNLHF